jgi:hypothetical protein
LFDKIGATSDTDISILQFGQISIVSTMEDTGMVFMIFSFRPTECEASKNSPGLGGARQSEKQELEIVSAALRQRLDRQHHAPIIRKSRGKNQLHCFNTLGCGKY